jgi:hypothetical protein
VKASGRYFTTTPPRGALVAWKYGRHGHVAISAGAGRIVTTDPHTGEGRTGEEPLTYPHRWGASASARIWTDQYNGVRFPVAHDNNGGNDMSDADDIARAIWTRDIIPAPTASQTNPTWTAGSYLKEILLELRRIRAALEK